VGGHTLNTSADVELPVDPPTGPIKLRTLGGSSEPWPVAFTGFAGGTIADHGTPANAGVASANVREVVRLFGSDFTLQTEIVFPTWVSNVDQATTRIVTPSFVSADGTFMDVVVPDDAMTGDVH